MKNDIWRNTDYEPDYGQGNAVDEPEAKPFGNISPERVKELYQRIKPVLHFKRNAKEGDKLEHVYYGGELHYLKEQHDGGMDWLYHTAYTWDPEAAGKAEGLEKICELPMKHSWAYYGFFKPSINEVMGQIPAQYLDEVVAFETLSDTAQITGDYHTATTVLYKAKNSGSRNERSRGYDNDIWRNRDS